MRRVDVGKTLLHLNDTTAVVVINLTKDLTKVMRVISVTIVAPAELQSVCMAISTLAHATDFVEQCKIVKLLRTVIVF